MSFSMETETADDGCQKKWMRTEKIWTMTQIQGRELLKYYKKNSIKFSQIFQIPGLRKFNMENDELIFDLNECEIQILQ